MRTARKKKSIHELLKEESKEDEKDEEKDEKDEEEIISIEDEDSEVGMIMMGDTETDDDTY
ncbi:MAG: hypothetical protein V1678_01280 [Candidatus Aenigmatarchaeota archaeon]